jgi:hypothetical protein
MNRNGKRSKDDQRAQGSERMKKHGTAKERLRLRNRRRRASRLPATVSTERTFDPGWQQATDRDIEAILDAVPAELRHAYEDALTAACDGFGEANFRLRPKESVLRGLALVVLPAHAAKRSMPELEAACAAVGVVSPDRWWIKAAFEAYDAAIVRGV